MPARKVVMLLVCFEMLLRFLMVCDMVSIINITN